MLQPSSSLCNGAMKSNTNARIFGLLRSVSLLPGPCLCVQDMCGVAEWKKKKKTEMHRKKCESTKQTNHSACVKCSYIFGEVHVRLQHRAHANAEATPQVRH